MTDQNPEQQSQRIVTYRFPVRSKGKLARFATNRFSYELLNLEVPTTIMLPKAPPTMLQASVMFRVFQQDYVETKEALQQFDELTPGLDDLTRELTHGIFKENGHELKIMVKGRHGQLEERNMPAYICDPSRKEGRNEFMQILKMNELLQAFTGDDRTDRIMRRGRPPLIGQRVGKTVTVSGTDAEKIEARNKYSGWVFVAPPGKALTDFEKKTATFNSINDVGFAVYMPFSTIRVMLALYFEFLPEWRELIEKEHDIVQGRQRLPGMRRPYALTSGKAPKEKAPAKATDQSEPTHDPKAEGGKTSRRRNRKKDKAQAESKPEGEKKADTGDGGEPAGAPVAEA